MPNDQEKQPATEAPAPEAPRSDDQPHAIRVSASDVLGRSDPNAALKRQMWGPFRGRASHVAISADQALSGAKSQIGSGQHNVVQDPQNGPSQTHGQNRSLGAQPSSLDGTRGAKPERASPDTTVKGMAERLGAADVAKLGKLAEEPSLLSKKLAEGVFSGIGSNSPDPLPPRVRRYYLAVAFATVAAGLVVSCFIAGASKQIDWTWAICGIAVGLLLTVLATLDALEKRIPFIDNTGPIAVGIAAATWLLIGWQTWIVFHSPTQGYTQAQLDEAVTKALDPVQKTLDAEIKQRNAAVTAEQNANRQLAQLTQSHAQIFPFPQAFGTTCALNLTSIASAFWDRAPEGAGVLITAAPGNDELKRNLLGTFSIAWSKHVQSDPKRFDNNKSRMFLDGPNNAVDIDAPRLAASDKNGVIIHGGDPQETFRTGWSNYFVVRHTSKVPEGLAEYYKVPSIVWIEIGPGDPWTRPFSCSAG